MYSTDGYIIRTGGGEDLREQMREQMRSEMHGNYRGDGYRENYRNVSREFEQGYREGYRDGFKEASGGMESMTPAEKEAYMKGMRDAYGKNKAENRNQL